MPITQRIIEVSIKLAPDAKTNQPGAFAESGSNTVTLSGSRTSVRIQNSGAPSGSTAHIEVFGMTSSLMNQLATLGLVFNIVPRNTLTVMAGDAVEGLSPVFSGTILSSFGDYNSSPNVPFIFECQSGLADAVAPALASSFPGSTDVATIMAGFARQMNVGFENSGVSSKLASPYFSGNIWTQMRTAAAHAGINAEVINGSTLAIWPKGGNRTTPEPYLIAAPPDGQMVGYPAYTQQGIIVKNVFAPQIAFGGTVRVKSIVKLTTEIWAVQKLDLSLDTLVPKGDWLSTIYAYNPNYPKPIPPQA